MEAWYALLVMTRSCYQSLDQPVRQEQQAVEVVAAEQLELLDLQARLEALGLPGPLENQVQLVLGRLALLALAPPALQEMDRWVLVDLLAQLVLQVLQAQPVPPGDQAQAQQGQQALAGLWEQLDKASRAQLARQATPAVKDLWAQLALPDVLALQVLTARADQQAHPANKAPLEQQVQQVLAGRTGLQDQRDKSAPRGGMAPLEQQVVQALAQLEQPALVDLRAQRDRWDRAAHLVQQVRLDRQETPALRAALARRDQQVKQELDRQERLAQLERMALVERTRAIDTRS